MAEDTKPKDPTLDTTAQTLESKGKELVRVEPQAQAANKPKKRRGWLYGFGGMLVATAASAWLTHHLPKENPPPWTWIFDNYAGNVLSGILGSIAFLFLAFYLDQEQERSINETRELSDSTNKLSTEIQKLEAEDLRLSQQIVTLVQDTQKKQDTEIELIKRIEALATQSNTIAARAEQFEEEREREENFITNLRFRRTTNIRFPNIPAPNNPGGLDYTITPARNPDDSPTTYRVENSIYYVVMVLGPSFQEVRTPAQLSDYERSPIHTNEWYFAEFFDGRWHLMPEDFANEHWEFYESGHVSPVFTGRTANLIAMRSPIPPSARPITRGVIGPDGHRATSGSLVTLWFNNGQFTIQINDSPLKVVNPSIRPVAVLNLEGYWVEPEARRNFLALLEEWIAIIPEGQAMLAAPRRSAGPGPAVPDDDDEAEEPA